MIRLLNELPQLLQRLLHADLQTQGMAAGLLVLAVGFLSVGAARWVEYSDFGFSKLRRRILVVLHLIGCVLVALAFAVVALDLDKRFTSMAIEFLGSAMILLVPIQIYIGLIRRKILREKYPQAFR